MFSNAGACTRHVWVKRPGLCTNYGGQILKCGFYFDNYNNQRNVALICTEYDAVCH